MLDTVWMPRRSLLAVLLYAKVRIVVIVCSSISKCVEGIERAINKQRQATQIARIIKPRRIKCPNIQSHLIGIAKPKDMFSNPENGGASAVVL